MEIEVNERYRTLTVIPSTGPYGYGEVEVFGCNDCGNLVFDKSPHDFYHDELLEATAAVYEQGKTISNLYEAVNALAKSTA